MPNTHHKKKTKKKQKKESMLVEGKILHVFIQLMLRKQHKS